MRKLGYIRVSRDDQNEQRQVEYLRERCDALYIEKLSAVSKKRPAFNRLKRNLKSGDTLVVLDLDRAFRSTIEALQTEKRLRKRGIGFEILSMRIDNNTPEGELMFTIFSAFSQYERRLISRRTIQGMQAAKAKGIHIGRPLKLSEDDLRRARMMLDQGKSLNDTAAALGCVRQTLLSALERAGDPVKD